MSGRGIMGFLVVGLVALAAVFAYNRFLAKPGKSIANLGEKS